MALRAWLNLTTTLTGTISRLAARALVFLSAYLTCLHGIVHVFRCRLFVLLSFFSHLEYHLRTALHLLAGGKIVVCMLCFHLDLEETVITPAGRVRECCRALHATR